MVTVENNQSILDLAVRYYGRAEAAFQIAEINGLEVTDRLEPGTELLMPEVNYGRYEHGITEEYRKKKHQPATAAPLMDEQDMFEIFGMLPGMLPLMLS